MPMYDYLCDTCGTRVEHFHHSGHAPDAIQCEGTGTCSGVMHLIFDVQALYSRPRNATRFDSFIVHRKLDPDTGKYIFSYPPTRDTPPDPGYEVVEMKTIAEADRFCRDREAELMEERQAHLTMEKQYWDERTKSRREKIEASMRRAGISHSKIYDMVKQWRDQKRERRYSEMMRRPVNFHLQVLAYDSSNRPGHASPETGWKEKKY